MSIAGPLDLFVAMKTILATDPLSGQKSGLSAYTAFTVWAYQKIYGDLYTQPEQIFSTLYARLLDTLFDGGRIIDEGIISVLPASPRELLTPGALQATLAGSNQIAARLRENDLFDEPPASPLVSCHGTADDTVPYGITVSVRDRLAERGFALTVLDLPGQTHQEAFTSCLLEAVNSFR
jgi:hypothetical protein